VSVATKKKSKNNKKTKHQPKKKLMENMQKNLPLVFELVLKLRAPTCTWQVQGKYHINQAKHSSNARKTTTTRDEQ
jgi:hypothetical protein